MTILHTDKTEISAPIIDSSLIPSTDGVIKVAPNQPEVKLAKSQYSLHHVSCPIKLWCVCVCVLVPACVSVCEEEEEEIRPGGLDLQQEEDHISPQVIITSSSSLTLCSTALGSARLGTLSPGPGPHGAGQEQDSGAEASGSGGGLPSCSAR